MKKIINAIVTVSCWALAVRGGFAFVDDVFKFIDKRREAKKNADTSDEYVGGIDVTA